MPTGRFLILMRHATADADGGGDHARALSLQGVGEARAVGQDWPDWLSWPDHALVSDARRTQQSLQALAETRSLAKTESESGLYLASAAAMLERIQRVPTGIHSLLVLGHNPGIHELALLLVPLSERRESPMLMGALTKGFAPADLCVLWIPERMVWAHLAPHEARLRGMRNRDGWVRE